MTMCVAPVVPSDPTTTFRLTVSKATALRHLKGRIEHGVAIRRRRVRYVEDLEQVRAAKTAWVQAYTELLRQMFHGGAGGAVADACNDWVGRVYPEYAESEVFVEQFYDEMDYRISRLREVARQIAGMPEYIPMPISEPGSEAITLMKGTPNAPGAPAAPGAAPSAAPGAAPGAASSATVPAAAKREALEESTAVAAVDKSDPPAESADAPVCGLLVLHGGAAQATTQAVQQYLRDLGMEIHTLPPGPREGKSAIAALERHPGAAFAVILLGAEDSAAAATFELGYFVGRLGLPRVCVLRDGATEAAVDRHGIACLALDGAGGWHLQLARHLKRAGIEVDLNKLC
jgi:hypothetical protein